MGRPAPAVVPCHSTPCGREAGEIPAQSRYGERPPGSASPVADHTVHARTFERKVGRTVRLHRLDPSFDPFEARGSRFVATPPSPIRSGGSRPCSRRPRPPVAPRRPAAVALLVALALRPGRLQRRRLDIAPRQRRPRRRRQRPPRAADAPTPTPSPTPAPAFPVTLTDDEGTAVTLAAEPQKIVSLTPAVTETLFAVGAGEPGRRHRRRQRLPGRGQAAAPMS